MTEQMVGEAAVNAVLTASRTLGAVTKRSLGAAATVAGDSSGSQWPADPSARNGEGQP